MSDFIKSHLRESTEIIEALNVESIENLVSQLVELKEKKWRLFVLGVGGSAANSSHAVNDFRKLASIEAYAHTDNIAELTARTNDEGWETVFSGWLRVSKISENDKLLVLSVGGGDSIRNVSPNLIEAINLAKQVGAGILGIVGRDGGYTAKNADACVIVPNLFPDHVTPHAETFQALIWHLLVSHPLLKSYQTKW